MGRIQRILLCTSIVLNAISAGGIFCFPMFSPSLALHLNLSQGQLSTIALAGMSGQYPFAMLAGMVIDRIGPWASSLLASIFFYLGFGLFSVSIMRDARPHELASQAHFLLLVLYFLLAGLGTVTSYFSSLFAASKVFPARTGLATGVVNALFGLSPLFLSTIGTLFFPDTIDGLDAPQYLLFLALYCGTVTLLGAFTLRAVPKTDTRVVPVDVDGAAASPVDAPSAIAGNRDTESAPLIPRPASNAVPHGHDSLLSLVLDRNFLLLAFILLCTAGMSEMVISNVGTIVASFARPASRASGVTAGSQVRLLSLANTISRLTTGPIADFTSPIPIRHPSGERHFHPKRAVTRVAFVFLSSVLLLIAFMWMAVGIVSANGVWFLSIMSGGAYGMIWTVVPSIIESVWGSDHAARNFGTLSYAPFIGTPIFSFLYAFMSDKARDPTSNDPICRGSVCWRSTFTICSMVLVGVVGVSVLLWKRWRKLV